MASFANKIKSLNQTEFRLHDYQIPMFLLSPTRILSDLCLQYPRLNDDIHDTNIDYKLVEKLQICYQSSKLLKILKSLKSSSNHGKMLVDFTTMLTIDKDETEVSDLLLLLSVYTANREEYRTRVVNVHKSIILMWRRLYLKLSMIIIFAQPVTFSISFIESKEKKKP